MIIKNKKGQHETAGFVLIILIVVIISLVFLWFFLRSPVKTANSVKISNLLSASMYYTSNCSFKYIPNYKTGQDLIKECFKNPNEICDDGRNICKALNESYKEIIEESLMVGEDSPIKGYKLKMYFKPSKSENPNKEFLNMFKGNLNNCTARYAGTNTLHLDSGNIEVKLEICENNVQKNNK
ncbi:MAG: hypothetical protein QXW97_03985 [Candidatus Pacearchaeota archaeon]